MTTIGTPHVALIVLAIAWLAAGRAFCAQDDAPADREWTFTCQRQQIAPEHWLDEQVQFDGQPTLALAGGGKPYANGAWVRTIAVQVGKWRRFQTQFRAEGVAEPYRSVLARVVWLDADGKLLGRPEYPRTLPDASGDGWRTIRRDYLVPEEAARARLELIFRWDARGKVYFSPASFEPTDPPEPRKVKLATIFHKPDARSAEGNLKQFAELIAQAAEQGADIVCLPEGATSYGTKNNYTGAAEPIPGPSTEFLGRVAREHGIYVVAGLLEQAGPVVHNTSVLIDRAGKLLGTYRKVCLPREEIEGGVTPGDSFGVFQADFGAVGMMICWDNQFPEPARALALNGSEVILMPIWGGNLTLAKARAIENQVYLVSCTYGMISAVIGLDGEILAEATADKPVAVAEVDLSKAMYWPWLGDFAGRIRRKMPTRSTTEPAAK